MQELHFQILGERKKRLDVVFRKQGDQVVAGCTCPGGTDGICQHRINILAGSTQGIVSNNAGDVRTLASWISGTDVGHALHEVMHAAVCLQNATDDFNAARTRLVQSMREHSLPAHAGHAPIVLSVKTARK